MSVVLAEPANAGQPSEGARELVAMQRPEVGPADGELFPGAEALLEHETEHQTRRSAAGTSEYTRQNSCVCVCVPVCRAVHGFESVGLGTLRRHREHVLAVVLPVSRALP